jgi:hypothetical protein
MAKYSVAMWTAQVGALALVGFVACSSGSSSDSGEGGAACNPCENGDGSTGSTGTDSNPYGVPYPSPPGGYGRTARSGSTPGSVIQNFKFLGYPNSDESQGLQTISLADYYDPCNKTYKILHLSVAAVWCDPCNEETTAVVADLGSSSSVLNSNRVVFVQALDDGPVEGTGATVANLQQWITSHSSNFTEMLDPGLQNLGGFFNAAAIPWNCDIDVRTMEILDSSEGWSGSVSSEIQPGLAALPAQPGYPLPANLSCN